MHFILDFGIRTIYNGENVMRPKQEDKNTKFKTDA